MDMRATALHARALMRTALVATVAVLVGLEACSPPVEPVVASSAGHATYAGTYPDLLEQAQLRFTQHETDARRITAEFGSYPAALKKP